MERPVRKIYVTGKQLEKLLAGIMKIPTEPVGRHLTDQQFVGYASETYSARHTRRLDAHLASCQHCASEI